MRFVAYEPQGAVETISDESLDLAWVRTHYHRGAVETRGQRRWLESAAISLRTGGDER